MNATQVNQSNQTNPVDFNNSANSKKPKIVLMVCSSIAAYKSAYLARLLTEHFEVHVVLSKNASMFVGQATFQGLTHQKVWIDWDASEPKHMPHIEVTRGAIAIIIAPASANCMAKLANGIADDLFSTTLLARPHHCPVFLAPAMNHEMWWQAPTQRNLKQLEADKIHILGPISGTQACGEHGMGKMLEPQDILEAVQLQLHAKPLLGKKVIITAGPTREYLDAVRYLSNDSSGLMGFMLAQEAAKLGAFVDLITGPCNLQTPLGVKRFDVVSARDMHQAVHQQINQHGCDIFIGNAAVADWGVPSHIDSNIDANINIDINLNSNINLSEFTPKFKAEKLGKIKKQDFCETIKNLNWQLNPDIVKSVSDLNIISLKQIYCIAFAAEAENLKAYALKKQIDKNANMVIANHVGFINSTQNQVTIFKKNAATEINLPLNNKAKLAELIWQEIIKDL